MTSRGIGDVRRVLGAPKSWIEATFGKPEPPIPDRRGDPLLGFVAGQVTRWESQVVREAEEYRGRKIDGVVVQRYAFDILRQTAAVRRVLVRYAKAVDAGAPEAAALRGVLADLSFAGSTHPDWREDWNDEAPPAS